MSPTPTLSNLMTTPTGMCLFLRHLQINEMAHYITDLTGAFPFMSLEKNVCFLVVYHYETNAIMAVPIANFTNDAILKAFHQQFELLESKGHKI
jgi:hypothetical protein